MEGKMVKTTPSGSRSARGTPTRTTPKTVIQPRLAATKALGSTGK
jgi:hypothetical protein